MAGLFKLGFRNLLLYSVPVILSAISAIAVDITVMEVNELSQQMKDEWKINQKTHEMVYGLSRMIRNVRGEVLFPGDLTYRQSYKDGLKTFEQSSNLLNQLIQDPTQKKYLQAIISEAKTHHQIYQSILQLIDQGQTVQAKEMLSSIRMFAIDKSYNQLLVHQNQELAITAKTLETSLSNLNLLIWVSTILSIAIAAGLGSLLGNRLNQTTALEKKTIELSNKNQQLQAVGAELQQKIQELQNTQSQLIQTEKMSGLGQLVAGVAHEINNPINFIHGNIEHTNTYIKDLLELVHLYQQEYPNPSLNIQQYSTEIDLEFLVKDLPKTLSSMKVGSDRIRAIVLSLRNFSRTDEAELKEVDLHEGIDSTLLILNHRLKRDIAVIRQYGNLPLVECYPAQINQVFMNIINNAIDILEESLMHEKITNPTIYIQTEIINDNVVKITISDNGIGMNEFICQNIFNPFFTTKPIGKGTGLGMYISYKIVHDKHQGTLQCESQPGQGTQFSIKIPIRQYN